MQRFLNGPFSTGVEMSAQVLVVSNDGRLLFSGGHWDCSLRVTQLGKGKLVGRICRHIGKNFWPRSHRQTLSRHSSFLLLYPSHRCSYVLGSRSLWHLPHLWIKGHILYRVEGSPAGKHHLISISLHLAHTPCHQSSALWTVRVDFPADFPHGQCRFSVDMTRKSRVWLSALSWTWPSLGQR